MQPIEFLGGWTNNVPQRFELRFQKQRPSDIDRILLRDAPSAVLLGDGGLFLNENRVGNALMVDVVDQGRKDASKLRQRIAGNPVRVIVQRGRDVEFVDGKFPTRRS